MDSPAKVEPSQVRLAAMNLLARREHTVRELVRKLGRRFPDEEIVRREVERLTQEQLQSDQRFAESYLRQRCHRGYGPHRLRIEMRDKGLSDEDIAMAIEEADLDWYQLAARVYRKRFGGEPVADLKERARRARFMQYRGFAQDHYEDLLHARGDLAP